MYISTFSGTGLTVTKLLSFYVKIFQPKNQWCKWKVW